MGRQNAALKCFTVLAVTALVFFLAFTLIFAAYKSRQNFSGGASSEPLHDPNYNGNGKQNSIRAGLVNKLLAVEDAIDYGSTARFRFDGGSTSQALEVIQVMTNPPFLLAKPLESDHCKNLPGRFVKGVGYFAPMETTIFRYLLQEKCKEKNAEGKSPLVLDVGGNIGYFAAYSAKMGCRVKTFEPLPRAIRFLNATILMNNLDAQIEVHHVAMSSYEATSTISENCADTGQSRIGVERGMKSVDIRMETLQKYATEDVLLLKIDTEGFEMNVFEGAIISKAKRDADSQGANSTGKSENMKKDMVVKESPETVFDKIRVENILTEMKPINKKEKIEFLKSMVDKGYTVWNYCEHYSDQSSSWDTRVLQDLDKDRLERFAREDLDPDNWFPCEDILLTLRSSL